MAHPRRRNPCAFRMARASLCAALGLALLAGAAGMAGAGEVTYLERPVQVRRAGTDRWIELQAGDRVNQGDTVRTGQGGRVEVTLGPQRVFRMGPASVVDVEDLWERRDSLRATLHMLAGRLWNSLIDPLNTNREEYTVRTTTATLGVKGTRFNVDYDAQQQALQAMVLDGEVEARPVPVGPPTEIEAPREVAPPSEITRQEWVLLVTTDQKLAFTAGEEPTVVAITPGDREDEWVRFNEARDRALQ